ncbi:MAG: hypothetical protein ACI8QT_000776 [Halioglobus sp.]|jgi:hypothetical protein
MAAPLQTGYRLRKWVLFAFTACSLIFSPLSSGQSAGGEDKLTALTYQRETLSNELEKYQKAMAILGAHESDPSRSNNPAVRNLAVEMVKIKTQLVRTIEQEVAQLQTQITTAKEVAAAVETQQVTELESGPLSTMYPGSTLTSITREEENVARLLTLLARHYLELQESLKNQPSAEELAASTAAQNDAFTLAHIPYSVDKIRLSGSEGSTALALMTQRLDDSKIPESRRNVAIIFSIKTRLSGILIASENRSLKPVGKRHYVAKVRLQPGKTSIRVRGNHWEVQLPEDMSAANYLITLYDPRSGQPEFHIFPVDDFLAQENPYIPAWLSFELDLTAAEG